MNQNIIKEILYAQELSLPVLLLVLAVAFVLGAIHALGPGHGKSLMAAYLIGSKGRVRDALVLAATLTISHVFSVIIIGFIALWAADFFLPEKFNKWLGVISGIMILVIGLWLFVSRYRALKGKSRSCKSHRHDFDAQHGESVQHNHLNESNTPDELHSHSHPAHQHQHYDPNFSIRSNIALGISGGIIPCPKAIVILLLAISLQKIALGITIIVVFSLGLSFVLVIIGIVMVKAAHLLKGRLEDSRVRFFPVIGAIVIIGLGIVLTVRSLMV